jgi:uncharacterized membrane protein
MDLVHAHLVLNHVPVVGLLFGLALLVAGVLKNSADLKAAGLWTFVIVGLLGVAVFLTGEPAEDAVENLSGVSHAMIERHEEAGEAASIALALLGTIAMATLLVRRFQTVTKGLIAITLLAAMGSMAVVGWTANLGGKIRHSERRGGTNYYLDHQNEARRR